jgi:pimeloyl-ACP methyl ester carboxylesterase
MSPMKQPAELIVRTHYVSNHNGWELELRQCYDPHRLRKDLRPLMIVPGYGMNAFIFRFHPTGISMEAAWAGAGFDVWSVNLRAQGGSRRRGGTRSYDLREIVLQDIPAAIEGILKHTVSENKQLVDGVGASLGGTFLYAYLAMTEKPLLGSLVAIGAPLRWEIPFYGTQRIAKLLFPLAVRFPFLLRAYLHPEMVETKSLADMMGTIEDPVPRLNRQIGYWIRHQDLILNGVNVTERLAARKNPLLCAIANADGIVPRETALSGIRAMGSEVRDILEIGDAQRPFAHADLFISNFAEKRVFKPISDWLIRQEKQLEVQ